jgi:hypothetical protein
MVAEELKRPGWAEGELTRRRKGDKQETRIAQRLRMGSGTCVSNRLLAAEKSNA